MVIRKCQSVTRPPAVTHAVILSLSFCDSGPVGGIFPWSTALCLINDAFDCITQLSWKLTVGICPFGLWQVTQLLVMRVFTSLNNVPGVAVEQAEGVPPGGVGVGEPESLLLQEICTNRLRDNMASVYLVGFIFHVLYENDETRTLVGCSAEFFQYCPN